MNSGGPQFRFADFLLIPSEHRLLRKGEPLRLTRRDFELLVLLVEHAGHLLRKEELQQRLWPDTAVEEGNLIKHVSTLRRSLGDATGAFIETIPRVGFRFVAPVVRVDSDQAASAAVPAGRPRRYKAGLVALGLAVVATLAVALSRMPPTAVSGSRSWNAFAVLPFTNVGGEADGFGLGLADGIITRLSGQTFLPVRPTSAVRRYVDPDRPGASEIGRALNADVVLEGHVQRTAQAVRVTVQLIDVRAASPVWAETFDQPAAELFRLEDAIAERVVGALRLRLAAAEQDRLRRRYTANAEAYTAYLAGREQLLRYTPVAAREAIAHFERAVSLDPGYALARAGLAMASAEMYLRFASERDVRQWGERAEREAKVALELDADLAEAHLARAAVFRKREFNWDEAIAASRRALVLNPNLEQPHFFIAAAYYHLGLMEQSLSEMERGRRVRGIDRVDPLRIEGLVALFSGNFDLARRRLEEVSRQSSRPIGDTYLALAYYYAGDQARARTMLEQLATEASASTATRSRAALAGLMAASRERAPARRLLDAVMAVEYTDHHVAYSIGAAFAQLGEVARAIEWLRKSADTGFPCVTWYGRDPLLDPLRGDQRFEALLVGLAARRDAAAGRY